MTWTTITDQIDICVGLHLTLEDLDGDGIAQEIRLCMPSTDDVQFLKIAKISDGEMIILDWYDRTWRMTPRMPFTVMSPTSAIPIHWVVR